jgi:hypothetical protein
VKPCPTCERLGRTCFTCRQEQLRSDGRLCRRCDRWQGLVRAGPYRGLCSRCAAEQLELDRTLNLDGARAGLAAADRAEFEDWLAKSRQRRSA